MPNILNGGGVAVHLDRGCPEVHRNLNGQPEEIEGGTAFRRVWADQVGEDRAEANDLQPEIGAVLLDVAACRGNSLQVLVAYPLKFSRVEPKCGHLSQHLVRIGNGWRVSVLADCIKPTTTDLHSPPSS